MKGHALDDAQLVEAAKRGDTRAYEELVVRHQELSVRTAYVICGADAEDAVQDAFIKAFAALHRFRTGEPFRPWLLRIVVNEARNRRKSSGRRTELALRLRASDPERSAEEIVMDQTLHESLIAAVARLGERDRLLIATRYFLQLSERETADLLGLRGGTVKSRLSRALERLRSELGDDSPVRDHLEEAPLP